MSEVRTTLMQRLGIKHGRSLHGHVVTYPRGFFTFANRGKASAKAYGGELVVIPRTLDKRVLVDHVNAVLRVGKHHYTFTLNHQRRS